MAHIVDEMMIDRGQLRVSGENKIPTVLKTGPKNIKHCAYIQGCLQVGAVNDFTPASPQKGTVMIGKDISPVGALNALAVKGNIHQTGKLFTSTGDAIFAIGTGGLTLSARFSAADARPKPFDLKHPSKEGWRLRHACIEGPEVGVYCRGRLKNQKVIKLPHYWKDLVHIDSISVQLQAIGAHQDIIVKRWDDENVYLQSQGGLPINCFYHIYAERKDINPLIVEYEGDTFNDYPDPNHHIIPEKERNYNDEKYRGDRNTITL
tara:strand:- start:650 stop:1438 length:789 start_codon:yes stop_codon:yes gene_type:complete